MNRPAEGCRGGKEIKGKPGKEKRHLEAQKDEQEH